MPTYLITYHTYGTWLHGDARGSVDDLHNVPRAPVLPADCEMEQRSRALLKHPAVTLDAASREIVSEAIRGVCEHRRWELHAMNVRTNHVHIVVTADRSPERAMADFKAWATRRLREAGFAAPEAKMWTHHGSTRWINTPDSLAAACLYVTEGQGYELDGDGSGMKP